MDSDYFWTMFSFITLFAACGYALYRGERPEYIGAAILFAGAIGTGLVAVISGIGLQETNIGILAVDCLVLFAALHFALFSKRYWPMFFASCQLIIVFVGMASVFIPESDYSVFEAGAYFWEYPMKIILVLGVNEHKLWR